MSKIGKQQIKIPEGVTVEIKNNVIEVRGPKGMQTVPLLEFIDFKIADGVCSATIKADNKQANSNWGTIISLLQNAIAGVTEGYSKILDIEGVGFRAALDGKDLMLNVGYSHQVRFSPKEGIVIKVEKNSITVTGIDKYLVGQSAASIRAIKKPEPYKGKGIRYRGEVVLRKAGKKVAGTTS
ncbi:MAG: 50S ribosomal protein L6 [bacterium]|nr:50S ribosomal protein L6 [bacterium]